MDKQIGQFRKQSRSVEILKAWGPSFSHFADLGLSWGFPFFLCLRITFIFMNRIILIHESFVCLWGLLSGSCSFSFCPEVLFLGFSEFCCWASSSLKCCEKDKCINRTSVMSPTVNHLNLSYLAGHSLRVIAACPLLWAASPSSCCSFLLSLVHSEWHEFIFFWLQLFGIICTT